MKFLAFASIFIAAALLLAGCSGQASQGSPQGGNAPSQSAASSAPPAAQPVQNSAPAANNAQPPANPTPSPAPAPSKATTVSAYDALVKFFNAENNGWSADYDFQSGGTGESASGKMAMYFKNTETLRIDTSMAGVSARSYVNGSDIFSCFNLGSSWSCMKITSYNKTDADVVKEDIKANPSKYTVEKMPSRTIAGASAECYKSTADEGWAEYCFSPEGVPLYVHAEGTSQGVTYQSTMTATSYRLSVADSDFILPASPTASPSFPIAGASGAALPSSGSGASGSAGAGSSGAYGGAGAAGSGGAGADTCSYCSYLSGSQKADCLASCGG